jgi:phosphohistidine phosphatase
VRVVLLRHGIAVDREDPACPPDPERPLTPEGVARTKAAARGLRAIGVRPDAILTSPYVRAVQTAEIAARVLGDAEPESCDHLLPAGDPAAMAASLRARPETEVLCAGHEPNLSLLLAHLVHGGATEDLFAGLKKAGAACVETERPGTSVGELLWLLPPSILRRLGGEK